LKQPFQVREELQNHTNKKTKPTPPPQKKKTPTPPTHQKKTPPNKTHQKKKKTHNAQNLSQVGAVKMKGKTPGETPRTTSEKTDFGRHAVRTRKRKASGEKERIPKRGG